MKTHMRHGATKNSIQWLNNMGESNKNWYEQYGKDKSLCWSKGYPVTNDNIKEVSCKKCLNMMPNTTGFIYIE